MRSAVAILGLWIGIAAQPAAAQAVLMPGAPPVSAETAAAFEAGRRGDPSALLRLAQAGRDDARTYAGLLLVFSGGSPEQKRKGCALLEAASGSRADAMHTLGEAYQDGLCGPADRGKAMATFRRAGDMGMAKSRCAEGNLLIASGGDKAKGLDLCRQGAELGDADAQTDLGDHYLRGQIVPRDVVAARGWYEKAAAAGHRNASVSLGKIYWNGNGVARDPAAAARLWRAAYAAGRADAAMLLGDEAMQRAVRKLDGNRAAMVVAGQAQLDQAIVAEAVDWYERALKAASTEAQPEIAERLKRARLFKTPGAQPSR